MRRVSHYRAFLRRWWLLGVALNLALYANGCSTNKATGSMRSFTQSGKKTLVEVVDKEAQSWKLLSVDASSVTTYFIVNAKNKIDLIATTFKDNGGTQHAVVLVDSSEKEESLAVLDRKFLMG